MGESICLLRSLSQPADMSLRESHEAGVTRRVLKESVSFGRFESESLQWEKWSAFTQNRYLEELERFTIPGSVAVKKAFFEAHFKSRASGKTTTTKIKEEEANVVVTAGDETVCQVREDNLLVVNNGMTMDEASHGEVCSVSPSAFVIDATTDVQTSQGKDTNLDSKAVPEDEAPDKENSTSSGSKTCSISSKLEPSFSTGLDLPLKKAHNGSKSSSNAKDVGKADKKERPSPSSVHMPLRCASSARQTTKPAPKTLSRKSTTEETNASNARSSVKPKGSKPMIASRSRKRPLSRAAKEDSDAPKCSTRASTLRLPELPPPSSRPPVDKRNNITPGSSVSVKIPNNVQRQPPSSCGTRAKPFIVSSPFNFRSDERAERRKEVAVLEKKKKKDDVKKQNTHIASEEHKNPQAGGFKVPMISLTSPRFLRNQTPGREKIKKSHKSPIRVASVKKNTNTRNPSMEKHKHCKIHPSQTKKKTQENSSPNIL